MLLDLLLVMTLGFLGSFGHCVGMCGPLTVAFSLSQKPGSASFPQKSLVFHCLLNLGRVISYALVGTGIGALGSMLLAGGQLAGIESPLRRGIAIATGIMLVWLGLAQIQPGALPRLPLLQQSLHQQLSQWMRHLSLHTRWWTPVLLGGIWGLMPCGFLYTAQIKAAETGTPWLGGLTLLAFGLGTLPAMLGIGLSAALLSADRRSQLFRMGGWVTLAIGIMTLFRGGMMADYTGHAALACLTLALIARPLHRLWAYPLRYRRLFGVSACVLAVAHMAHMLAMGWNLQAIFFLLPTQQMGSWMGILAIGLMIPLALTSFDWAQQRLGDRWRPLHLLSLPAYGCAVIHTVLLGSRYLGTFQPTGFNQLATGILLLIALSVFLVRSRWCWTLLSLEKFYGASSKSR
jgi:hypothetical protein